MKYLAWSYPLLAASGILFWIILATPLKLLVPGDGSLLILGGLTILGFSLIQLTLWSASGIRGAAINHVGKGRTYLAVTTIGIFCIFSIYVLLDLYIGGP